MNQLRHANGITELKLRALHIAEVQLSTNDEGMCGRSVVNYRYSNQPQPVAQVRVAVGQASSSHSKQPHSGDSVYTDMAL